MGRISFLHVGDARIELLERDLDMRRPSRTDSIVTDLDHYTLAAADPGATVGAGVRDGRRAVLRDPDGIRFELLDRPALPPAPVHA